MVKAYILIEMAAGKSGELVRRLKGVANVRSVSRVTGPYDVIAIIEDEDLNKVHDFVTTVIHKEEGVLRTTTSVSVEQ
ncbi:MAG: Lrp/AsnC ligand binding domain-containing protein [Chloroflexi bacterium]|nr:Lrp/AsnC ligand binding domain-containing protein [Chloroflexota bacterium]MCH9038378.1 Lrp/AsnC ligand binding domain-containing protein [Chloroflexota bacterium]MCI0840963.1 Lrp/AsnC ligand binding domain-containing protein [Chloroflexota bacterium]MCI0868996.1 Lrp/AsnC ligand binding domain-containing protein [Chloroflexota bacterium]